MQQEYEYKFVRLEEGCREIMGKATPQYHDVIKEHARDGWRLVQIFAPPLGVHRMSNYVAIEVILERRI